MDIQHTILTKVTKIESYLYDDDDTNTPGIVARQRDHDERITKLERESMVRKTIWGTLGVIGGTVGAAVVEVVIWIFKNHKS